MDQTKKMITRLAVLILAAVVLSACGTPATPEPTPDMDAYATSMVQTVEASFTETAVINNPIDTPVPTYTPVVLSDQPEGAGVILPMGVPEESGLVINPDVPAEGAPAMPADAAAGEDKAEYESQSPQDNTHVEAGSEFDVTWYLRNAGTSTWTTDYSVRYLSGTNLTKPGKDRFNLTEPVEPGRIGAWGLDAIAPTTPGTYNMTVVFGNGSDQNFTTADITIIVD